MSAEVVYESQLELARLLLADFDPEVIAIFAQPFLLAAVVKGRQRRHVPDFVLLRRDGTVCVVNVKPPDRLKNPVVVDALAWPGDLFTARGWDHEVWSGAAPALVDNVRLLAAYRRPVVSAGPEAMDLAWRRVPDGDQLMDAEFRLKREGFMEARAMLLALLWAGKLRTDLSRALSASSVLRRSDGGRHELVNGPADRSSPAP